MADTASRMRVAERDFLQAVRDLAQLLGWADYHTWRSIHSPAGFPDLVLVRPPRIVFVELKVGRNRPTQAQQKWLDLLKGCPAVEVCLWTPEDWDSIVEQLR